jgi:D-alanyl-D-alanine carboxypeptidase
MTVLRLEEQGQLALSDTLDRHVEGIPNGHIITLEHLLSHTSGLPSANEDPSLRARNRRITWEEELGFLQAQGAMFCPGQYWRYSNSGYILLGKVIEKVTGKRFHDAIRQEVVQPLGLENLRMLAPEDPCEDVAPLAPADPKSYRIEPTWPGPAGSLVASAEDMVRLWCAFLRGEVVGSANVRRMFEKLYPMFDQPQYYGFGVMVYEVPQPDGSTQTWLGHSGGTSGAKAVVAYVPEQGTIVAVALTGDAPAEAVAFHLIGNR